MLNASFVARRKIDEQVVSASISALAVPGHGQNHIVGVATSVLLYWSERFPGQIEDLVRFLESSILCQLGCAGVAEPDLIAQLPPLLIVVTELKVHPPLLHGGLLSILGMNVTGSLLTEVLKNSSGKSR